MSQFDLLRFIAELLNRLEIPFMLVGSHASSFYGEPRSTHDIDIVINLDPQKIQNLVCEVDSDRFYLSESALKEGRMANLIDMQTGDKVDMFILDSNPVNQTAFDRRSIKSIMGIEIPIASAEDTMEFEEYEDRLAATSAGGREGLVIRDRIMRAMPGEQKVAKSFELTELTRQIMRAGIREAHPHASEEEIQQIYVARLLQHQGISLTP